MEEINPRPRVLENIDILKLSHADKAERLWYLFNEKILDVFLRDCEMVMSEGIVLDSLPAIKEKTVNFKVEYKSMKRAYLQAE